MSTAAPKPPNLGSVRPGAVTAITASGRPTRFLWIGPNDDQDIRRSLARAFERAWDGYYRSERLTVSQDIARTELAKRLVQLSKRVFGTKEA